LGCPDFTTDLSLDDAHAIIEPYFFAAKEAFKESGLSRVGKTLLYVAPDMHDTARHYGACKSDGLAILVAPELAELPEDFVIGILYHEFGHATDFLYPGEFTLGREEAVIRRVREEVSDKQWLRWQRMWDARDHDVVEKTADQIAGKVWGQPIGYAGPCLLQNFKTGEARPRGLR
jgi:hypothetical protein